MGAIAALILVAAITGVVTWWLYTQGDNDDAV